MPFHYSNDSDYLAHYGVPGQKKGVRKYQNEDGSLTPEGYRHYGIDPNTGKGDNFTAKNVIRYKNDVYKDTYKQKREEGYTRKQSRNIATNKMSRSADTKYGYTNVAKADRNTIAGYELGAAAGIIGGTIAGSLMKDVRVGFAVAAGTAYLSTAIGTAIGTNAKIKKTEGAGVKEFNDLMGKEGNITNEDIEKFDKQVGEIYKNKIAELYDSDGNIKKGKEKDLKKFEKEFSEFYYNLYYARGISNKDKEKILGTIYGEFYNVGKNIARHGDEFFFESPDEYLIHSGLDFLYDCMYG